jgi:hypothetical protein
MQPTDPVPSDMQSWVDVQVRQLQTVINEARKITDHDTDEVARWALHLLPEMIEAESRAKRVVHLLTAYLLRHRLASPTAIARASEMTVTGVQGRGSSATALDAWDEIWPASNPKT